MYATNFYVFLGVSIFFLLIAVYSGRSIESVKDYFHRTGDFNWFLSLSAANVTLGTGVVYYLSSSSRFGWLMLLSPIMVLVGYMLFAKLLNDRPNLRNASSGNFLQWADEQIEITNQLSSRISFYPTLSLVITFVLILAYEIYASATIFSQILFDTPTNQTTIYIASLLASVTMIYALWGGVVAVLKTDRIQIIGVLAVIGLLAYAGLQKVGVDTSNTSIPLAPDSSDVYWGIAAAVCGAIATQFYSLLNWGAVSNFPKGHNPAWTLRATGILTFILLSVLVLVGLSSGSGEAGISFKSIIDEPFLQNPNIWTYILVAGMVCIVFSTADSLMIQITMFTFDNLLGKNSMDDTASLSNVRNLRLLALLTFGLALSVVIVFIATQQDLLYLLFAVAGGVIVYAPLMFIVLVMSNTPSSLQILSGGVSILFFGLFILAFGGNITALVLDPSATAMVVTLSFIVSCLIAVIVFAKSVRSR